MSYKKWVARQKGNPLLLGVAALGFITGSLLVYRGVINPWFKKRRLEENERYAQIIIQKDKGRQQQT